MRDFQPPGRRVGWLAAVAVSCVLAATQAMALDKQLRRKSEADFTAATASFLKSRDIASAVAAYESIIGADPTYAKAMYNLATLEERRGNIEKAIVWLERYLQNDKGSRTYRANAQGRLSALRDVRSGAYSQNDAYEDAVARAVEMLESNASVDAYTEALGAAEIDDQRFEAYAVAASALMRGGDFDMAREFLQQAQQRAPEDKQAELRAIGDSANEEFRYQTHMSAGRKAQSGQKFARAGGAYALAAALFPEREASLAAGIAYALAGDPERAERYLTQALERGDADVSKTAGEHLKRLRGEAELAALDARAQAPIPGWGVYLDGLDALKRKDPETALDRFDAAIARVPVKREYGLYFQMRGATFLALGQPERSLEDLGRALLIDPSLDEVHRLRAVAHARTGEQQLALRSFNQAVRVERDPAARRELRYARAGINRALGNHWAAVDDLDAVLNEADGWPKIRRAKAHVARGASHDQLGSTRAAMSDYDRASRLAKVPARVSNRLSEIRDRWVVVMNKAKYFSSSFVTSKTLPDAEIKAAWKNKHDVAYVVFDHRQQQWLLGIAKDNPYNGQSYWAPRDFPLKWIQERFAKNRYITSIDYGNGHWFVVMSGTKETGLQRVTVSARVPVQAMEKAWSAGRKVQHLKYGAGKWALVTGAKSAFGAQILIQHERWPERRIELARKQGYGIVTVGYGGGDYAIVMGKTREPQRYRESHAFPRRFVQKGWRDSFDVGAIVHVRQRVDS
ncbi:MAG: tetratricopeptide repeat protein [Pseudomonadota bacterium]